MNIPDFDNLPKAKPLFTAGSVKHACSACQQRPFDDVFTELKATSDSHAAAAALEADGWRVMQEFNGIAKQCAECAAKERTSE